jgi:hypothetical protein
MGKLQADTQPISFSVRIEYVAIMTEPKQQPTFRHAQEQN